MADFKVLDPFDAAADGRMIWALDRSNGCNKRWGLYVLTPDDLHFEEYREEQALRKAARKAQKGADLWELFEERGKSIPLEGMTRVAWEAKGGYLAIRYEYDGRARKANVACSLELGQELFGALKELLGPRVRLKREAQAWLVAACIPLGMLVLTLFLTGLLVAGASDPSPRQSATRRGIAFRIIGGFLGVPLTLALGGLVSVALLVWVAVALAVRPLVPVLRRRASGSRAERSRDLVEAPDEEPRPAPPRSVRPSSAVGARERERAGRESVRRDTGRENGENPKSAPSGDRRDKPWVWYRDEWLQFATLVSVFFLFVLLGLLFWQVAMIGVFYGLGVWIWGAVTLHRNASKAGIDTRLMINPLTAPFFARREPRKLLVPFLTAWGGFVMCLVCGGIRAQSWGRAVSEQPAPSVHEWMVQGFGVRLSDPPEANRPEEASSLPPVLTLFAHGPYDYLAELQEFRVKQGPAPFTKGGSMANGKGPIVVNGIPSPRGLGLSPAPAGFAAVRYRPGKQAALFVGLVALNDTSRGASAPASFEVLGDGVRLWVSEPVSQPRRTQSFQIDVRQVDVLELRVHAQAADAELHAVWIEPRLLQTADAPDS